MMPHDAWHVGKNVGHFSLFFFFACAFVNEHIIIMDYVLCSLRNLFIDILSPFSFIHLSLRLPSASDSPSWLTHSRIG